jgi:hypothetical protein
MDTLQSACLQLLLSTQSHRVGFAAIPTSPSQPLGAQEQQLLDLYDKLHRVTLERRTLEAELADGTCSLRFFFHPFLPRANGGTDATKTEGTEEDLIQARSSRLLVEAITSTVLSAVPIIKSVHPDISASPLELAALLSRRDKLAEVYGHLSTRLAAGHEEIVAVLRQVEKVRGENRELAEKVLAAVKTRKREVERDEEVERELREACKNWEVARNVAVALVTGSGVDWARDQELRELVLLCGDE